MQIQEHVCSCACTVSECQAQNKINHYMHICAFLTAVNDVILSSARVTSNFVSFPLRRILDSDHECARVEHTSRIDQ